MRRLRREDPKIPTLPELFNQLFSTARGSSNSTLPPRMKIDPKVIDWALQDSTGGAGGFEYEEKTNPTIGAQRWMDGTQSVGELPVKLDAIEEHKLHKRIRELEAQKKELMDQLLNTRDQLGVMNEVGQYKIKPLQPRGTYERTT